MRTPTCRDCLYAVTHPGYAGSDSEPKEMEQVTCSRLEEELRQGQPRLSEATCAAALRGAWICPLFSPRPAGVCVVCEQAVTAPAFLYERFVTSPLMPRPRPVCSERCADVARAELGVAEREKREGHVARLEAHFAAKRAAQEN